MPKRVPEEAKIIGENIRKLRKSLGFSQEKMGEIIGVSFQQMQKYERGQNRLPIEKLHTIKHLFGASYEYFFEGMPRVPLINMMKKTSPFPESSVLHTVDTLQDFQLKRKIEKVIEILLS